MNETCLERAVSNDWLMITVNILLNTHVLVQLNVQLHVVVSVLVDVP